jgi:hypothetical protein
MWRATETKKGVLLELFDLSQGTFGDLIRTSEVIKKSAIHWPDGKPILIKFDIDIEEECVFFPYIYIFIELFMELRRRFPFSLSVAVFEERLNAFVTVVDTSISLDRLGKILKNPLSSESPCLKDLTTEDEKVKFVIQEGRGHLKDLRRIYIVNDGMVDPRKFADKAFDLYKMMRTKRVHKRTVIVGPAQLWQFCILTFFLIKADKSAAIALYEPLCLSEIVVYTKSKYFYPLFSVKRDIIPFNRSFALRGL